MNGVFGRDRSLAPVLDTTNQEKQLLPSLEERTLGRNNHLIIYLNNFIELLIFLDTPGSACIMLLLGRLRLSCAVNSD